MRALKALVSPHKPSLLFLFEFKIASLSRFSRIPKTLGFLSFEFSPVVGSVGGVALLWKEGLNVRILVANANVINAMVFPALLEPS